MQRSRVVVYDLADHFVVAASLMFQDCVNPSMLKLGVCFALGWLFKYFDGPGIVECGTHEIVLSCYSSSEDFTKFRMLLYDNHFLSKRNSNVLLVWVKRQANVVAHGLARESKNYASPICCEHITSFIINLLVPDSIY